MTWDLPTIATNLSQAAAAIGAGWLMWLRFRKRLFRLDASLTAASGMVDAFGPSPAEEIRKRLLVLETMAEALEFRNNIVSERLRIGIYMCGLDAHCTYANPQLADMFKLDRDQMLGWGWLSGLASLDQARVRAAWQLAVKEQLPFRERYRLRAGLTVETEAFLLHNKAAYIGYVMEVPHPDSPNLPVPTSFDNVPKPIITTE